MIGQHDQPRDCQLLKVEPTRPDYGLVTRKDQESGNQIVLDCVGAAQRIDQGFGGMLQRECVTIEGKCGEGAW
jgi:hypothetical protein